MERDEWTLWEHHLPEIREWLPSGSYDPPFPSRRQCLAASELRAFAWTDELAERFRAVVGTLPFHKLPNGDLELLLRVFLQLKGGRNAGLRLGETGRRLLAAAEKKEGVAGGYLEPFRELVHRELE